MSTSRADASTQWTNSRGWTSTEVQFYGFADLPTTRDELVRSPAFSCFGHHWELLLYPGGRGFSVRDANSKEVVHDSMRKSEFGAAGTEGNSWSIANFAKRSTLIDALENGSLIIEVRVKLPSTGINTTSQFIPTNPIIKNVLKLFNEEETADVVFEVGGQQQTKGKRKKVKSATTIFHAHRNILQNCAPTLYEMCKSGDGGITVSITDVKPEIFKHMIYYAYGGKLSDEVLKTNVKDIINACDKYGLVHLKLEAEACYVESNEIKMENMMDNLLYADSKNLALLKEAVMDYIVKNKHSIIGKVSFDNVPSSMITDVLTAMARGEQPVSDGEEDETIKYNKMRVGTLRKMLDERGLDVDGSREAMIALLKEQAA